MAEAEAPVKEVVTVEAPERDALAYVLFAHCFTCGKDIAAASRISRALVARGYAVLRFDFTGLGSSDGLLSHDSMWRVPGVCDGRWLEEQEEDQRPCGQFGKAAGLRCQRFCGFDSHQGHQR